MATKKKSARRPPDADAERKPLLGALLRLAHESVAEHVAQGLVSFGFDDLPPDYVTVVQPLWVDADGASIGDLATHAGVTRPSMVALVESLEARGYVTLPRGRTGNVLLTERGRTLAATIRALVTAIENLWSERFGEKRIEALRDTLIALVTENWQ